MKATIDLHCQPTSAQLVRLWSLSQMREENTLKEGRFILGLQSQRFGFVLIFSPVILGLR